MPRMFGWTHNLQVLDPVIVFYPIDMMNDFIICELSSKVLLHHVPVVEIVLALMPEL